MPKRQLVGRSMNLSIQCTWNTTPFNCIICLPSANCLWLQATGWHKTSSYSVFPQINFALFQRTLLVILLEARLRPNVGCYNSAESEQIWMQSGPLWGWLWQILGTIRAVATVSVAGEIFFLVRQIMHDFTYFPSAKFHEMWTQQCRSVSRWKLSEHNF